MMVLHSHILSVTVLIAHYAVLILVLLLHLTKQRAIADSWLKTRIYISAILLLTEAEVVSVIHPDSDCLNAQTMT